MSFFKILALAITLVCVSYVSESQSGDTDDKLSGAEFKRDYERLRDGDDFFDSSQDNGTTAIASLSEAYKINCDSNYVHTINRDLELFRSQLSENRSLGINTDSVPTIGMLCTEANERGAELGTAFSGLVGLLGETDSDKVVDFAIQESDRIRAEGPFAGEDRQLRPYRVPYTGSDGRTGYITIEDHDAVQIGMVAEWARLNNYRPFPEEIANPTAPDMDPLQRVNSTLSLACGRFKDALANAADDIYAGTPQRLDTATSVGKTTASHAYADISEVKSLPDGSPVVPDTCS